MRIVAGLNVFTAWKIDFGSVGRLVRSILVLSTLVPHPPSAEYNYRLRVCVRRPQSLDMQICNRALQRFTIGVKINYLHTTLNYHSIERLCSVLCSVFCCVVLLCSGGAFGQLFN